MVLVVGYCNSCELFARVSCVLDDEMTLSDTPNLTEPMSQFVVTEGWLCVMLELVTNVYGQYPLRLLK